MENIRSIEIHAYYIAKWHLFQPSSGKESAHIHLFAKKKSNMRKNSTKRK